MERKGIAEILRPAARRDVPARVQLAVWLAYHELGQTELAELCNVVQSTLAAVVTGRRKSAPLLECLERVTGIPAGAWTRD